MKFPSMRLTRSSGMNSRSAKQSLFVTLRQRIQGRLDRLVVLASRASNKSKTTAQPRVSVLIPTLPDRLPLLMSRAVTSILAQEETSYEVLIITDHFDEKVATSISGLDARFRYLWGARVPKALRHAPPLVRWCSAATPALNMGLKAATGDFIARLDDDDSWHPLHLTNSLQKIDENGVDFISSASVLPDGSKCPDFTLDDSYYSPQSHSKFPPPRVGSPITWVYARRLRFIRYSTWSWRLKHNRPADINLSLRFWRAGVSMGYLSNVGAYVGLRDDRTSWGLKAFLEDNDAEAE